MGECAFGRGFGSVAPDTKPEPGFSKEEWQKIPDAIVKGLSMRYAVSPWSMFESFSQSMTNFNQMVFFKRTLRKLGLNMEFDWPAEMVTVSSRPAWNDGQRTVTNLRLRLSTA
jgi:hypothetical protein